MAQAFYTVGHSTRTLEELVALLRAGSVEQVIDVRSMPRSRSNPQFNREGLPDALAPYGIDYSHCEALAGLRKRSKTVDDEVNAYWHNQSFHNYADYALSSEFKAGLAALIELGRHQNCAVMCAEALWWRCHRRIIADHLLHRGEQVYHLMSSGRVQAAALTEAACTGLDGDLVYPGN